MASSKSSGGSKRGNTKSGTSAGTRPTPSKRELIDTGTDKRYVRRSAGGQFKESDDVGRASATDQKRKAKTTTPPGQGDRGDRKR